ncbi:hypothetical protein IVB33_39125 [Bradyrhizobium sp. 24]|nr:hypothetical protein [Bradyrhizobium sp. 24]
MEMEFTCKSRKRQNGFSTFASPDLPYANIDDPQRQSPAKVLRMRWIAALRALAAPKSVTERAPPTVLAGFAIAQTGCVKASRLSKQQGKVWHEEVAAIHLGCGNSAQLAQA